MKPMTEACGCCEGIEIVTPEPTANRPGLSALSYRIGTHAAFLETMLARLSGSDYPKLAELKTRETDDPAIALLDAWAVIADVLTFYNERIINEGYLRTATERRSILEMARLVGYQLRPGVASSVYLAYTVDDNFKEEAIIAKGAKSQSIPGPDELPQTFETSEGLKARAQWNNLKPRMTRPQTQTSIQAGGIEIDGKKYQRIYLKGINTNLNINDPLLIDYEGSNDPDTIQFNRVKELRLEPEENRTLVILQSDVISIDTVNVKDDQTKNHKDDIGIIEELTKPASVQPENSLKLPRNLQDQFGRSLSSGGTVKSLIGNSLTSGEASSATLKSFAPMLKDTLSIAQANAEVTEPNNIKVYALRAKAGFFGHNYPGLPISVPISGENRAFITVHVPVPHIQLWPADLLENAEEEGLKKIIIEPQNEKIQKEGWIVIERPRLEINPNESGFIFAEAMAAASSSVRLDLNGLINSIRDQHCKVSGQTHTIHKVQEVQQINQQSQNPLIGINAKVDLLTIEKPWLREDLTNIEGLLDCVALLKESVVYTQSEKLELAEEVIGDTVCGGANQMIELDGFYDGLETGRWVMVSGEREIAGTSGVKFSELTMLSSVRQDIRNDDSDDLQGDKLHTFIKLANELNYCFKRDTVTIYGNVVKATHGDTRKEILGSGDGAKALQSFVLKQPPLTHVPASKPSGVDSTLRVFVNDVQWDETDALTGLSPADRHFITKTDDDGKTTLIFGNGREGARLPTGIENIKAEYRNGIGKPGNVKAGQISLPITRPLGVKEVINPLPASGGADKESRDQARKNAPLAVKALDRLVSVQDYEDFARVYAGVGKACAAELSNGLRQLVHVTIAGSDDIPIDKNSDLYRNLRQSLLDFGDPFQPLQLEIRELMFVVIQANIRILPDYQWEPVVTEVRSALLGAFSFERRELGQDVVLSEVLGVMQAVRGVAYVDVDAFGGIPEKQFKPDKGRQLLTPAEIAKHVQEFVALQKNRPNTRLTVNLANFEPEDHDQIHPAQLAFLTPEVSETLILNQIH
jgi:hypothetical protein